MEYLFWVIIGLVAYSVVAPIVSIITKDVQPTVGLFLSTVVFLLITFTVMVITGTANPAYATNSESIYVYAAGVCLAIGIVSYVFALELGPVSVVVPIYGMFIVGSSVLGIVFLNEELTATRIAGIVCAIISITLAASEET